MESKEYSWAWVAASQMLTDQECELVYAHLVPSAATTLTVIYNGTGTGGDQIVALRRSTVDGLDFIPAVPIYCRKGLYINIGAGTTGVLVIWRNL